jgi:hypothetical protein
MELYDSSLKEKLMEKMRAIAVFLVKHRKKAALKGNSIFYWCIATNKIN